MKKFLACFLALLFLTAFSSFATGAKEGAQASGKLVVWWWGEQDEPGLQKWMNENVDLYQKRHPNVKIDAVLQSTDQLIPAFQTAAQSNSGPDIEFFWAGAITMENAFNGYLAPIADYWSSDEITRMDTYPKELTYQGKVWTSSFYSTIASLVYNKGIFKQAGLDPEKPPAGWAAFLDACGKIKAAGFVPFALGNKTAGAGHFAWLEGPMGGQNLDTLYDYLNVFVGNVDYKDRKYSEWLYKLEELWKKGYINNDVNTLEMYQVFDDYFASGKAAMTIEPGGAFRKAYGLLKGQAGIMKWPVFGTGKSAGKQDVWRKNWGITKWSANKPLAADFLRFMASRERADAMYEDCGAFSGSQNFDSSIIKDDVGKQLYGALKYSYDGVTNAVIPPYIDYEGIWTATQKMFAGEYSADQAAKFIADTIAKWQKDNPDMLKKYQGWAEGMK